MKGRLKEMTSSSDMWRSPEKSSFSLACRLLSQFIKDKGCPSDLGLGMPSRFLDIAPIDKCEGHRPPTTMSLLPGVVVSDEEDADEAPNHVDSDISAPPANSKESENGQLTIFYGSKVVVFDDFPPEKAMELMQLASGSPQKLSFAAPTTVSTDHVSCRPPSLAPRPQPNFSDLPIARKASLHRFLEKRKHRIGAKAPYQASEKLEEMSFKASKAVVAGVRAINVDAKSGLGLQQ